MSSAALPPPAVSPMTAAWQRLLRNRLAVIGLAALLAVALACLIGPALAPHAYDRVFPDYVKTQYRAKMDDHLEQMRDRAQAAGLGYHLLTTDKPLDRALTEYLSLRQGGR